VGRVGCVVIISGMDRWLLRYLLPKDGGWWMVEGEGVAKGGDSDLVRESWVRVWARLPKKKSMPTRRQVDRLVGMSQNQITLTYVRAVCNHQRYNSVVSRLV
jgi:hypothetical protein